MTNQRSTYDIVFFISVFLIFIFTVLSVTFILQGQANRRNIERRRQMEMELNGTLGSMFEMESRYRGMLLSSALRGKTQFENIDSVLGHIQRAQKLAANETGQLRRLERLQQMVLERKRLLDLLISYYDIKNDGFNPEIADLVLRGDDVSDKIRKSVKEMLDHERSFEKTGGKDLKDYDIGTLIVILTFGCVTLLIVVYGYINVRRENKKKEEIENERLGIISRLQESELRYRGLNDTSNDAIIIADQDGKIISFNQMASMMFGYAQEEILGKHADMLLADWYKETNYEGLQKYLQLKPLSLRGSRLELNGKHKSGKQFPAEVTISYWENDHKYFFGASVRNITTQKQSQEKLNAMMSELRRSNEDLEQFAYIASHDLQEPLRKIRAFGERLTARYAEDESIPGREYAMRMVDASERMQVLIRDLLSFSRVSRDTSVKTEVDLNDTLKNVLDDLQVSMKESGAEITSVTLPVLQEANPLQMQQLFLNLLSNAIKFRKHDEKPVVHITWEQHEGKNIAHEDIRAVPDKWYYEIHVTDNGIGFDNKYLEKIFTIFQRLHGRSETEYQGTGIGLALCKKICNNHEGFITAKAEVDKGATFIIILPK